MRLPSTSLECDKGTDVARVEDRAVELEPTLADIPKLKKVYCNDISKCTKVYCNDISKCTKVYCNDISLAQFH